MPSCLRSAQCHRHTQHRCRPIQRSPHHSSHTPGCCRLCTRRTRLAHAARASISSCHGWHVIGLGSSPTSQTAHAPPVPAVPTPQLHDVLSSLGVSPSPHVARPIGSADTHHTRRTPPARQSRRCQQGIEHRCRRFSSLCPCLACAVRRRLRASTLAAPPLSAILAHTAGMPSCLRSAQCHRHTRTVPSDQRSPHHSSGIADRWYRHASPRPCALHTAGVVVGLGSSPTQAAHRPCAVHPQLRVLSSLVSRATASHRIDTRSRRTAAAQSPVPQGIGHGAVASSVACATCWRAPIRRAQASSTLAALRCQPSWRTLCRHVCRLGARTTPAVRSSKPTPQLTQYCERQAVQAHTPRTRRPCQHILAHVASAVGTRL